MLRVLAYYPPNLFSHLQAVVTFKLFPLPGKASSVPDTLRPSGSD